MKKGSQVLKLPVVNVDMNEKMGAVTGFVFDPDEKKVAALVVEPASPMEGLRAVPFEKVVSIYDTALMVHKLEEPVNISENKPLLNVFLKDVNLVGSMVVSDEGKTVGVARDFIIDAESGRILQIKVRIRGGSGERAVARDDIVSITADEIVVRPRPDQVVRGAAPDAAEPKPAPPSARERRAAEIGAPAKKRRAAEAEPPDEQPAPAEAPLSSSKQVVDEIKKEIRTELFSLFETFFADRIKGHFLEMVRMVIDRINQAQPEEKLQALRDEILGELNSLRSAIPGEEARREEIDEQVDSLSLLVEEKIKQGAGSRLDTLSSRIEEVDRAVGAIREKSEAAAGEIREAINRQAEILGNLPEKIQGELSGAAEVSLEPQIRDAVAKIDSLKEGLEQLEPIAGKANALREQVAGVHYEMLSLREIQDSLRKTWMEIATGLSERFDTIESRFKASESREGENRQELVDKIKEIIASQGQGPPGKDELLSLTTKLETTSARLKNLEEETSSSVEEIIEKIDDSARGLSTELHAAVTRSTAPLVDNLKRSLEKRVEELRTRTDTFKDEMVELQDVVRTSTMRMEKKLDERLAEEISRLSEVIAGISSEIPNEKSISDSLDGIISSINEAAGSLAEKIDSRDEPIGELLETRQQQVTEELRNQTEALADRVREMAENLSLTARKDDIEKAFAEIQAAVGEELSELRERIQAPAPAEAVRESLENLQKSRAEADEKNAAAVEKLMGSVTGMEETIGDRLKALFDKDAVSEPLEILRGTVKSELDALKESVSAIADAPGIERLENEIEDLRNFVKQKIAEIADINEIAREDEQKQLLDRFDKLLEKNVADRLEAFISKHLDANMASLLEKLVTRPEAAKGIFGRTRAREKPAEKPRVSDRPEAATEKRLEYLIGRTVGKDLLDDDGNPVVAKGTVVDEKLLSGMREQRRLLDLIQCIDFTQ